jgi:hypothetical protein
MEKPKTFTLEQAQALLPVLQSRLKSAMDSKKVIEQIKKEFQDLRYRILLTGGLSIDITAWAARREQHRKSMQEIKDALAEVHAIGVQVKDLDIGLLDFPCAVDDEIVLLCWKFGEDRIEYWHGLEEGFKGRKRIDERILGGKNKEKPI